MLLICWFEDDARMELLVEWLQLKEIHGKGYKIIKGKKIENPRQAWTPRNIMMNHCYISDRGSF